MKHDHHRAFSCLAYVLAPAAAVAGCSASPGEITRDSEPFSGIAPTATVTAVGTEPFWSIAIEPDGAEAGGGGGFTATYSSPENIDGSRFAATRFAGNNGVGFAGTMDGSAVVIALTPGDCSDAMSERTYPYVATVQRGQADLRGCAYTSDEPFTGEGSP